MHCPALAKNVRGLAVGEDHQLSNSNHLATHRLAFLYVQSALTSLCANNNNKKYEPPDMEWRWGERFVMNGRGGRSDIRKNRMVKTTN